MTAALTRRYGHAVATKRAPGRERWWVSFDGQDIGIVAKSSRGMPAGQSRWIIEEAWFPWATAKLNEAIAQLKGRER